MPTEKADHAGRDVPVGGGSHEGRAAEPDPQCVVARAHENPDHHCHQGNRIASMPG